ncbi:hypothetical protein [Methylocella tundrae]|uniref:Uncharacterized protein n=1 Tax=Methylocella tundrae TaxID=227605 RepID=A0A4U8Z7G8_METTU|nr:hypothetical protein [Methylocella tundrae]WPP02753.1 hypothetical protein SIN04_00150 [Methylocella tundrae]VFU17515.1 protein of unknown function [Methylocella tundrae]
MDDKYDWATTGITHDGHHQLMHIYRCSTNREKSQPLYLDQDQSRLLNACLQQLAKDTSDDTWSMMRQAILRAFYETLISSTRSS